LAFIFIIPGVYFIYSATKYNQKVFPQLYKQWQDSWFCNKCGNIYQEPISSKENILIKKSLINCPYCNKQITEEAISCSSCGAPVNAIETNIKERHFDKQRNTTNINEEKNDIKKDESSIYRFFVGIFNWVIGIGCIITGLGCLVNEEGSQIFTSLILFIMSALLLPPIRAFIFSKTNKRISTSIRGSVLVILLIILINIINNDKEEERQKNELNRVQRINEEKKKNEEKKALVLRKNLEEFNSNRNKILSEANDALEAMDFEKLGVILKQGIDRKAAQNFRE
jgi:DNA-directed RNA polymerase subunit RPC12/RpoP